MGFNSGFKGLMTATLLLLDVHGSVHRNIHLIERTNKMQPYSRIYYFIVF